MKLHTYIAAALAFVCLTVLFFACTPDAAIPAPSASKTITLNGLSDSKWVYFSFSTERIVGSSKYGSSTDDATWRDRLDWDIAICGDRVKTNSGSSGSGKGGMYIESTQKFEDVVHAPTTGYQVDERIN